MDKIIEALAGLFPFAPRLQSWGVSQETSAAITAAIIALLGVAGKALWQYLVNHYKNSRAARDLAPYFDYQKVKASRALFIPTQFQNQSPTREEEPAFSHKFVSKSRLIPFFMNTAFDEKKESDKFYLVLADSGMGKTTFMINLYVQYTSFFNWRRKYKIRLYPFGDARILEQIKQIKPEEARQTILLLDAFDEDKKLIPPVEPDSLSDDERFRRRLDEIIEAVRDFREVVITSRTQYFPGQDNQPYELQIPRFDDKGFHKLAKLYLSPFDGKEIKRYLNKKYGRLRFWNRKKKQTATAIVNNSPKLMVRPMLLSYIDYLVDSNRKFESTYQIYETLVEKWIDREARKRRPMAFDREKFRKDLHQYSQLVALEIYRRRKTTGPLHLQKEAAIAIANQNNLDLRNYEITGQSLLTRDADQNWKFAHKSILEYFLAKECVENASFAANFEFTGMDQAETFYKEMTPVYFGITFIKVEGGMFAMGDEHGDLWEACRPVHNVNVAGFYIAKTPITQKQWHEVMGNQPSHFKNCDDCPVENVSWNEVQKFIAQISAKTGKKFCLPTEAEWEYAARGGHRSPLDGTNYNVHIGKFKYAGSDNLDEVGWYEKNSERRTHPVAKKKPNELGLYDMSGNVWEWCQDKWHDNYRGAPTDGTAWVGIGGSDRVLRGGSWINSAPICRSAFRSRLDPADRGSFVGFRLVFVP